MSDRILRPLLVLVLALAGLFMATPASAAGELAVTITSITETSTASGVQKDFRIQWACSSVTDPCLDAKLSVPLPAAISPTDPNYQILTTFAGATPATSGWAPAPTVSGGVITWTFAYTLPAGTSGEVSFSVVPGGRATQTWGLIPNNSTVTPVATFSATGSTDASSTIETIVTATNGLRTAKIGPTAEPVLDSDVTYTVVASYPQIINLAGDWIGWPSTGWVKHENIVVTDHLPEGAVFVSASHGGAYDAATHTVTWPTIAVGGQGFMDRYTVTIQYPSTAFTADGVKENTADNVTNFVHITGTEISSGVVSEHTANATHGFATEVKASASIGKSPAWWPAPIIGRGTTNANFFTLRYANSGNVPLTFHFEDLLPCPWASPTDANGCNEPFLTNITLAGSGNVTGQIWMVTYTTNTGVTSTIEWKDGVGTPLAVAAGEYVIKLVFDGTVAASTSGAISLIATVARDIPTEVDVPYPYRINTERVQSYYPVGPDGRVLIENCMTNISVTHNGTPLAVPDTSCAHVRLSPLVETYYPNKTISNNAQPPGGVMTIRMDAVNSTPWSGSLVQPVMVDLLPENLDYVDGSFKMMTPHLLPNDALNLEIIRDWNGTGRTMVRASWDAPAGVPRGTYGWMTFQVQVREGAPVGTYQNTMALFNGDEDFMNPDWGICASGSRVVDTLDLDGDGNTTEFQCVASANYTVLGQGALSVVKEVKGSEDVDFLASPAV